MQLEELVKALAVLRRVDRVGACAEDVDAVLAHELRELYSGLTAESDDDAEGLLGLDNIHHVLVRQRLKIESVGGVEVGRDSLRVVVDDDDVISGLLERPDAVHRRVVELDALTYSDRACTEDYDGLLSVLVLVDELCGFVLVVVGRVEVRRFGGEFCGAGVDHLVDGGAVHSSRERVSGQLLDDLIREAELLCREV